VTATAPAWTTVEVTGASMLPALRPGDWLLVRRGGRVRVGDVVVARHPWHRHQLIVKRAAGRTPAGWWLESDNQRAPGRQDSWDFGEVPDELVVGRVVARYWPPRLPSWPSGFSRRRAR
jgi:nickel-type superoxide dismutase maturation protease